LEEMQRQTYDVILMDCQMPELDGYDVTRRLRLWEKEQHRAPVYIIAVTAHAMEGDRERCVSAGMNDYITKPVHLAQLESALTRALKRKSVTQSTGDAVLDPACLAGLKDLRQPGAPDPLTELFDLFHRESAACLERLHHGAADHDARSTAQAAHTLKGSASNLGASNLARLCAETEQHARASNWEPVAALLQNVETELARVRKALAAEV
jgi:HPt (histidine-containing phosphotransfer) domain-containing protein